MIIDQEELFDELEWVREKMGKYDRTAEGLKQAANSATAVDQSMIMAQMILCKLIVDSLQSVEAKLLNWKGIIS